MSSADDFPTCGAPPVGVRARPLARWGRGARMGARWLFTGALGILRAVQRQARARRRHLECVAALGFVAAWVAIVSYLTWQGLADRKLTIAEQTRTADVELTDSLVDTTTGRSVLAAEHTTRAVRPPPVPKTATVSRPASTVSGRTVAVGIITVALLGGAVLGRRILRRFRYLIAARAGAATDEPPEVSGLVPSPDEATDAAVAACATEVPEPGSAKACEAPSHEQGTDAGWPSLDPTPDGRSVLGPEVSEPITGDAAPPDVGLWLGLLDERERSSGHDAAPHPSGGGDRVVLFERDDASSTGEDESLVRFRSTAHLRWGSGALNCSTVALSSRRVLCEIRSRTADEVPPHGADAQLSVLVDATIMALACTVDSVEGAAGGVLIGLRLDAVPADQRELLARTVSSQAAAGPLGTNA